MYNVLINSGWQNKHFNYSPADDGKNKTNEIKNKRKKEQKERTNEGIHERTNERIKERTDE